MKIILLFIFILLTNVIAENVTLKITEVFPDPKGKDNSELNKREFIEIYNYGEKQISLENCNIMNIKNKSFNLYDFFNTIEPKSYLVIYPMTKFSLKNKGNEKITLVYNDFIIDEFKYSESKENLSWININGKWVIDKPTPGFNYIKNTKKALKTNKTTLKHNSEKLLNIKNDSDYSEKIYESQGLKQRKLGFQFFSATLLLVIITLLIEKWQTKK